MEENDRHSPRGSPTLESAGQHHAQPFAHKPLFTLPKKGKAQKTNKEPNAACSLGYEEKVWMVCY
jgi:hypothetical protein